MGIFGRLGRLPAFVLPSLLLAWSLHGQVTTGDVLGTVTDPSGGTVPNARIVLTNKGTQEERTVESNASGEYRFTFLQNGHYKISASAPGFKSFVVEDFALNAGDRFRQEIILSIGQNTETVEVTSVPPALDTDSSVVSTVVTSQQVANLPLNGRNFIQLAQLSAGANEGTPGAIANGSRPDDRRQTASVSVNAQPDTLNNQMVDGLDNFEGTIGTIGVRPSVEAIAEFRVQTSNYPAESGKTPGAVLNLITKSGTNDLHGSAYEFLRNDKLDGRDFFATIGQKPEYRQNQFGGSVGGPIKRNKTFFFGDYEALRIIQGTTYTTTVPTAFELKNPGNLSDTGGPLIPASQLNPIALKYFALYPAPNLPGAVNNFSYSPNVTQYSHTADVRVDHHFSDKDNFFVRYTFNRVDTLTPSAFPAVNGIEPGGPATYAGTAVDKAHQILLNHIHIFGPRVILELKAGYTRINNTSYPLNYGKAFGTQFGIVNSDLDGFNSALPNISITGYGGFGDSQYLPLVDRDNTFQYSGALTQTLGAHTLKYGATLIRRQIQNYQSTSGVGAFSFNTNPGGNALANFLTGTAYQVTRIEQLAPRYLRSWEPSVYVQDDWRITRKVTLNLGLRYDVITPDVDVHNFISNFDPATATLLVAGQNGVSRSAGIKTDWKSVAPRAGFAANVRKGMVLRGGYAKVFFRDNTGPQVPFADPPYVTTYSPNPLTVTLSAPLPVPAAQSVTNLSGAVRGMALDYENSYVHQASFNVEQALGATVFSAGYVGSFGRKLRISPDLDLAPPSADPFATRRAFYSLLPNVTSLPNIQSKGYLNYNGLQVTVQRRFSRGLTANANYTWSHAIGDVQGFSQGGLFTSAIPSQTATLERGNSDFDVRHRFALMLNYELPFGRTLSGWQGGFVKGWQLNAIDVWQTGFPFSVVNASPRSGTGVGSDRPNLIASPQVDTPTVQRFFNTAAFQPQASGTIGSEARDAVYGPHFRHFDLSLFRIFRMTERLRLEARAESFNLTNTPNFGQPNATVGTAAFGIISSTRTGSTPRQLQFALKLMF